MPVYLEVLLCGIYIGPTFREERNYKIYNWQLIMTNYWLLAYVSFTSMLHFLEVESKNTCNLAIYN